MTGHTVSDALALFKAAEKLIYRPATDDSRQIDRDSRALRAVLERVRPTIAPDARHSDRELFLTHAELAALIRASTSDKVVPLRYGPGWAALDVNLSGEPHWALNALRELRTDETGVGK